MIHRHGHDWGTAKEIADVLGDDVTEALVRKWGHRGLMQKLTWRSSTWYLLSQAQAVEVRTRLSRRGRKRGTVPLRTKSAS